jgi:hypothetical protein
MMNAFASRAGMRLNPQPIQDQAQPQQPVQPTSDIRMQQPIPTQGMAGGNMGQQPLPPNGGYQVPQSMQIPQQGVPGSNMGIPQQTQMNRFAGVPPNVLQQNQMALGQMQRPAMQFNQQPQNIMPQRMGYFQ